MIKIYKCGGKWVLIDEHQSYQPLNQYDDLNLLLEDLQFILEGYNIYNESEEKKWLKE